MAHARNATEVAAQAGVLSGTPSGTGAEFWHVRLLTVDVTVAPGLESTDTATGYLRYGPNTRVGL